MTKLKCVMFYSIHKHTNRKLTFPDLTLNLEITQTTQNGSYIGSNPIRKSISTLTL